jgi:hypothetical protein
MQTRGRNVHYPKWPNKRTPPRPSLSSARLQKIYYMGPLQYNQWPTLTTTSRAFTVGLSLPPAKKERGDKATGFVLIVGPLCTLHGLLQLSAPARPPCRCGLPAIPPMRTAKAPNDTSVRLIRGPRMERCLSGLIISARTTSIEPRRDNIGLLLLAKCDLFSDLTSGLGM